MAVTSVNILAPLTGGTITSSGFVGMNQANGSTDGFLSSSDWSLFNDKVGGSGTTNNIPKWATSSTLSNSLLIDRGTSAQVDSFTPFATMVSNGVTFMSQQNYGASGLYINDVTATYNKQGIFQNGSSLEFYTSNPTTGIGELIAVVNNTTSNYVFEIVKGFTSVAGTSINIPSTTGIQPSQNNSSNFTHFSVTPTIDQLNPPFTGSGQIRGFYYAPPSVVLGGTTVHNAWENTVGDIVFGNLTGTNTEAVTILSTGKLIKQSTLTAINLYDGSTAKGLQVDFANTTYILGNTATSTAGINIQSGHIHGIFSNLTNGLSLTYSNNRFQFGQIDPSITRMYFYVRGNQERAYFIYDGIENGLYIDFRSGIKQFILGDDKGINPNNANYIFINDDVEGIALDVSDGDGDIEFISTTEFKVSGSAIHLTGGANLITTTPPSNKLDYLVVTINGSTRYIQLWDV